MFEFSQEPSMTASHVNQVRDAQPNPPKQQKLPRRVWAVVAVIAILAVTVAGTSVAIAAFIIFKPSTSEPNALSVSDMQVLRQQVMEDLKHLLDQKANSSLLIETQGAIEGINATVRGMQLQHNSRQELQQRSIQELQQLLNNSTQRTDERIDELLQQLTNSTQSFQKLQHQQLAQTTQELQHQLNTSMQSLMQKLQLQLSSSNQSLAIAVNHVQSEFAEALNDINFKLNNSFDQLSGRLDRSEEHIFALRMQANHSFQEQMQKSLNVSENIASLQMQFDDLNSSLATFLPYLR